MSGPGLVLTCQGMSVRLAARRPDGKVLIEYLQPKTEQPLQAWRECWPHELRVSRGPSLSIDRLKQLIAVMPLVTFIYDGRTETAIERTLDAPATDELWWMRY
jgi:hypothetical protein